MFWGIILKPNTKYMTTVEKAFRISQACLEFKKPEDKICLKVLYKELEMILCYLSAQQTPQCALDLEFTKKERLTLFAEGSGTVHLTGTMEEENVEDSEDNFDAKAMLARGGHKRKGELMSPNAALAGAKRPRKSGTSEDDEDDTDFDSDAELDSDLLEEEEDEDEDLEGGSDLESFDEDAELDEDDDDDDDDEDEDEEDEDDEEEATPAKKPVVKEVKEERNSAPQPKSDKKKGQQKQQEARKSEPTAASDANKQNGQSPAKGEAQESGKKKKRNKKKKGGEGDAVTPAKSPAAKGAPASAEKSSKVVNKNGVQIEVLKQGTGPVAKSGKSVHMYYRGRLKANNKEFDHCTEGKGFRFRLGGGEVIKGWDIGVEGMKVGEKRRLVIPPKLGYGEKGVKPSIPPNAPLVFDVELKAVS